MSEPVIVLDKLTKSYGKRRGIDGVTFSVNAGEIFGFIGPNGAGKSTTLKAIMRLPPPESPTVLNGDIRFNGASLFKT